MQKGERKISRLVFGIVLLVVGVWVIVYGITRMTGPTVTVNHHQISVEVMETAEEKRQGLSDRESLGSNSGLLFVYDAPGQYNFWMKDMNLPIDIIWIADDYRVVDITKYLHPDTFPEKFTSSRPAQYVLEVNAGYSDELDVRIGDDFEFNLQ